MRLVAAIVLAGIILKLLSEVTNSAIANFEARKDHAGLRGMIGAIALILAVALVCIGILVWY